MAPTKYHCFVRHFPCCARLSLCKE